MCFALVLGESPSTQRHLLKWQERMSKTLTIYFRVWVGRPLWYWFPCHQRSINVFCFSLKNKSLCGSASLFICKSDTNDSSVQIQFFWEKRCKTLKKTTLAARARGFSTSQEKHCIVIARFCFLPCPLLPAFFVFSFFVKTAHMYRVFFCCGGLICCFVFFSFNFLFSDGHMRAELLRCDSTLTRPVNSHWNCCFQPDVVLSVTEGSNIAPKLSSKSNKYINIIMIHVDWTICRTVCLSVLGAFSFWWFLLPNSQ